MSWPGLHIIENRPQVLNQSNIGPFNNVKQVIFYGNKLNRHQTTTLTLIKLLLTMKLLASTQSLPFPTFVITNNWSSQHLVLKFGCSVPMRENGATMSPSDPQISCNTPVTGTWSFHWTDDFQIELDRVTTTMSYLCNNVHISNPVNITEVDSPLMVRTHTDISPNPNNRHARKRGPAQIVIATTWS